MRECLSLLLIQGHIRHATAHVVMRTGVYDFLTRCLFVRSTSNLNMVPILTMASKNRLQQLEKALGSMKNCGRMHNWNMVLGYFYSSLALLASVHHRNITSFSFPNPTVGGRSPATQLIKASGSRKAETPMPKAKPTSNREGYEGCSSKQLTSTGMPRTAGSFVGMPLGGGQWE